MSMLNGCRLYSSAHFNDTFPAHTPPEILNTSLEGLVLLMKAMHVDKASPHVIADVREHSANPQSVFSRSACSLACHLQQLTYALCTVSLVAHAAFQISRHASYT